LASFYYYVRALIEVHGPVIGGITGGIATAWAAWNKGLKPLKDWVIENLAQMPCLSLSRKLKQNYKKKSKTKW
jgi:hypothetical protein